MQIPMLLILLQKDGNDIPKTEKTREILSTNLFFFTAQIIPMKTPKTTAIKIETDASNIVFGNASASISETFRLL